MARRGENIYKRKDGRYEGRYKKGYNSDGTIQWGYVYSRSYAEVKDKLMFLKAQTADEKEGNSAVTVSEYILSFLNRNKENLKQSTFVKYQLGIDNYIIPKLGNLHLYQVDSKTLQKFVFEQMENGVGITTISMLICILNSAFKEAEKRELMINHCSGITILKKQSKKIRVFSKAEQQAIESKLSFEIPLDMAVLICMYTGIRIGEVCALKWENVDLENRQIFIRYTLNRIQDIETQKTKIIVDKPKSISSERVIPIPQFLAEILSTYKEKHSQSIWVINGTKHKHTEPRTLQYHFKKILQASEVKNANFHALRHTFATRALELGFDIKTLSEILGHSNANMTLKKYAHSMFEQKRNAMDLLQNIFSK